MSTPLDAIERLLHEADTKFMEKLRLCQQGTQTNMNIYSDRTYNLRQQVVHNSQLTDDKHFMEMLCDTEKFLAPEYTVRGELDKRLNSLLCGLLKTLLRESVAQPLYSLRKIQIEMIWQWYCDKKSNVLDFAIGKDRERQSSVSQSQEQQQFSCVESAEENPPGFLRQSTSSALAPSASATVPFAAAVASSKFGQKLERVIQGQWHSPTQADPSRLGVNDLTFREDATRASDEAAIQKKLCIYRKRNLAKAEKMRQEIAQSQQQVPDVKVVMTKDSKGRQKKIADAKSQNSQLSMRHGPSGPAPYFHAQALAPTYSTSAEGQTAESGLTNEQVLAEAHRKYISFLTRKLAEENDVKNFNDMMVLFAGNQARLREESLRRMESDRYASLVSRTGHVIERREVAHPPLRFNTPGNNISQSSGRPSTAPGDGSWAEKLGYVMYRGPQTSLSPYDVRTPSRLDEESLHRMANVIPTPDDSAAEVRARLGLLNPDPRNLVTTGSSGGSGLDVVLAPDAKITPNIPRLDIPIKELLFLPTDPDASIPSVAQLAQMAVVERLRENFSFAVTKAGKRCYMPRAKIEAAMISPDDRPYDECIRLLPTYGAFLPRAYEGAPAGSRPQTAAPKKKKK
jgi:hypothetical protein